MSYWENRWAADAERAYRDAEDVIRDIERLHQRATNRLQTMAKRIRRRFMVEYGLTEAEAKALLASPIGREEYLALLQEIGRLGEKNPMREALMAKAAAPGYAYRVSVVEGMLDEIDAVTARLAEDEQRLLEKHLRSTVKDKASRAMYQIQVEAGLGFRFNAISEELARHILKNPWSGMAFSARIWKNQDALADLLNDVLAEGLVAGNSGEEMAREIAEAMNVSVNRARTLVRTETTYVCNQADAYAYDEAEIGSYRYVAVLDMRTSKVCRSLDGTVHAVRDAVPGKNYPPMHPNCRSTTRPDISEDDLRRMERWARDPVTGEGVKVPANMTYEEWLKLQEETYGAERIKVAQKMVDNKASDKKQYKQFQTLLGKKQLPDTLEKFQLMKYTERDEWEALKTYVGGVKSGEISSLSGFTNYKDVVERASTRLIGAKAIDGLTVTGFTDHFVFRTIGSVEQRRNGVSIDETLEVLVDKKTRVSDGPTTQSGRSRRYTGEKAQVTINPDTGTIIQVNPLHSRKGAKT